MSRGMGKLQALILAYLREQGKPCWVGAMVWDIYNADKERGEYWDKSHENYFASVRRAIRSMKREGIVCCEVGKPVSRTEADAGFKLKCWLPEHARPETKPRLRGTDVERVVLDIITYVDCHFDCPPFRSSPSEKWIPYRRLVQEACRRLNENFYNRASGRGVVAVQRAVKRLSKRREIKAYWKSTGIYGWVALAQQKS